MITMGYEASTDIVAIEALLDQEFGPDRHGKTCQRLRDGQVPAAHLALVLRRESEQGSQVVGTLRFWDILVGQKTRALLLGPLAVDHSLQGTGLGSKLMRHGLNLAAAGQHGAVILVGDEPYYRRFGFRGDLTQGMDLPGPVDRARFLALELKAGALASASGMISPLQVPFAETLRRPVADVFGGIFA
jgi:predicted N-acetyltransferase YhbS